jgi:UDP-N-acetylglucosamine 2-epimerase (non-hydrolysing)
MICSVVGARPNFMKMAPVILEAQRRGLAHRFVHTGQHYDAAMSTIFFDELRMPQPDVYLGVGSGSHADQTARIMMAFEKVCLEHKPKLVIVAGDVNSTLACALVAAKLCIPVAHLEAGLRSFDRSMPEEINRILTDHISDMLFTSEPSGNENLLQEGIAPHKIHFVGNCMIDSLRSHLEVALARMPWTRFGVQPEGYGIITLHRPAVVDELEVLDEARRALREIAHDIPLLFPVHPRTRKQIEALGLEWEPIQFTEPLGYLDFLGLMAKARLVLTDSGGIQEETTTLGVPCVTVRNNTERPITVEVGTNRLAGTGYSGIVSASKDALMKTNDAQIPERWDGRAACRVIDVIQEWLWRGELPGNWQHKGSYEAV